MIPSHPLHALVLAFSFAGFVNAQTNSKDRVVTEIAEKKTPPSVRAIAPIDDTNVFFLTERGGVGVAKFSPGLSLIDWEPYSEIHWNAHSDLAIGPEYSLIFANPREVTQAFDTDEDPGVDFYQNIISEWAGKGEGVRITAGPVADAHGRLLFALSPFTENAGEKPKAALVAWQPEANELTVVTRSQLPIADFAISRDSLLAARLSMPGYKDGYYISLTELPSPEVIAATPERVPHTRPSLLIPAEMTEGGTPTQLSFFHEDGMEKLLLVVPETQQLIEIVPSRPGSVWQGAILLRRVMPSPIETVIEMAPGKLLAGGPKGFTPLEKSEQDVYRIQSVALVESGIILNFTEPIDRFAGSKPESYSVQAIGLDGGKSSLPIRPVIESDGMSVILRTPQVSAKTVLRVVCQNVPSEDGESLLSSAVFFTVHEK